MTRGRSIAWEPGKELVENSNLLRFMRAEGIADYETLLARSEDDIAWFWEAFIRFADIRFYEPYTQVVDLSGGLAWPKWFPGGKINLVHNFLDKWAGDPVTAERTALLWEGENEESRRYTFGELYRQTNRVANALAALGVERGDRVALYMPMIPETVIALYGIYKAGAVAVPLFSGFGPEAVAIRLDDVEAKAVITADGFYRGGQQVRLKQVLDQALEEAPTVKSVIVVERLGTGADYLTGRDYRWGDVVAAASDQFETVRTEAEEICMVSYSSGTTGKPKGIVHVHGGIAVKTAEVGMFVYDTHPEDIFFMITDFGWMMGQLPLFSAHTVGAPYLMYEGSPLHPHPGRLYDILQKYRVTVFGAPATALRLLKTYAERFRQAADLSHLRILGHTGEPIDAETWNWFLSWTDGKAPIINGSGGTEVFAEIISSVCIKPQKPTCLGRTPAVGAKVVDERGVPVPPGKPGYLVFTLPQPAQTRGFWKNPERYLQTYFPLGPGMWWQGDMVLVDEDGYWFHLGRADDVIKVSGRRTGPGEIEDVANAHPAVLESAVIGVPHPFKGEEIILLAVLKPGASLAADELKRHVAAALGKPYEPGEVHFVRDLPKTRTQKIMRRLIKQRYLGEILGDTSSLMNPEALDQLPRKSGES
ncbi:AMP-binding protein [Brevibacillus sp. SYP-B805]|uniref:AMP-binding protein n=1 Tax=Brevibacillus sp. SYP-B805 TaxID=1578199 RepID=UPI0013EC6142|nr:AMP-binding protein [Brevibacillus sp. SYP-B805]NGQ95294.1 AMP-binding protein [Brevibacillus sp. SYP-B805]